MILTANRIHQYASAAGFTGKDLDIAVAVALAESGGDTQAHNSTPPDNSYGLWQINMLGDLGPSRRKRFGIASNDALFDPATNARAAHIIWKDSGWNAWTTYTSGKYKKQLGKTAGDVDKTTAEAVAEDVKDTLNPLAGVPEAIAGFGNTVTKSTLSLAALVGASAMLITGIFVLARNTRQVKAVRGAVSTYATRGIKRGLK